MRYGINAFQKKTVDTFLKICDNVYINNQKELMSKNKKSLKDRIVEILVRERRPMNLAEIAEEFAEWERPSMKANISYHLMQPGCPYRKVRRGVYEMMWYPEVEEAPKKPKVKTTKIEGIVDLSAMIGCPEVCLDNPYSF